jgi:hypothetical protein
VSVVVCTKCDVEVLDVDGSLVDAEQGDPNCSEGGHHIGQEVVPDGRCGRPMRDGWCLLDEGHRGRHTTQVHYCDTCGKHRRGANAYAQSINPHDDVVEAEECWFCNQVVGPQWQREMYEEEMATLIEWSKQDEAEVQG